MKDDVSFLKLLNYLMTEHSQPSVPENSKDTSYTILKKSHLNSVPHILSSFCGYDVLYLVSRFPSKVKNQPSSPVKKTLNFTNISPPILLNSRDHRPRPLHLSFGKPATSGTNLMNLHCTTSMASIFFFC